MGETLMLALKLHDQFCGLCRTPLLMKSALTQRGPQKWRRHRTHFLWSPTENALVHRDYEVEGATCHIVVTADTIAIRSPGYPPSPITVEQMQAFKAPMLNRNPKLQFVFGGARLAEGRGLGMKTLAAAPTQHGLPLPKYAFDGIYLNLTIYRHAQAAVEALGAAMLNKLSKSERSGWEWLASKGSAKSSEYAAKLGMDDRTARRHLNQFLKLGLVRQTGVGPSTEYQIK